MTAVPAAIDGLLAVLRATQSISDVAVLDGQWIDPPSAKKDIVVIGWLPDEGYAIEWVADPASLGLADDAEAFSIHGLVSVNRGSVNLKAVRDRADYIFEQVRSAVRMDMTLRGAVGRAYVSALTATPFEDESGSAFTIAFSVSITVY